MVKMPTPLNKTLTDGYVQISASYLNAEFNKCIIIVSISCHIVGVVLSFLGRRQFIKIMLNDNSPSTQGRRVYYNEWNN